MKWHIKLFISGLILIICVWVLGKTITVRKVEGSEAMVRQHLIHGVDDKVLLSGTHFFCGWIWDPYIYDIGTQKITFDNNVGNHDAEYERIIVDCGEGGGQKAWIAMSINYRVGWVGDENGSPVFSPEKLVALHKDGVGETYESVIVKRTVVDVVNEIARPNQALDIYSGQGFVDFKEKVDNRLKSHTVFKERGIFVENTIIYKVYLDDKYETEIAAKVLAIQSTLRKKEETKAAEEEAKRAFAEAQANVEKERQMAEAMKIKRIKEAEAEKAEIELQAEAEKSKRVLEAEGNRDANLAMASGVLAVGTAEAQVDALKRDAMYEGEAGKRRANVEIAVERARLLKGMLQGCMVVPEKTIAKLGDAGGLAVSMDESDRD